MLVGNINDEKKDDDATLKWLKDNEDNLKKQFKGYPDVIDNWSHSLITLAEMRGKLKTMRYLLSLSDSDPSIDSPLGRSDSDTGHVSPRLDYRSDSDSSMGSLRLSFSPFDSPIDETPPLLRATRPDSPINLHMPRNIAMSNVEEFSYTDLPPEPRARLADVLDRFYKENKI